MLIASLLGSPAIYLGGLFLPYGHEYHVLWLVLLAATVFGALAVVVSRRARPRARRWLTLPAAFAGVLTPPVVVALLLVSACAGNCGED